MFESTSIEDDFSEREGEGAVSDYDVTMASRAMEKMREYAERQRRHMGRKAREIAERLNLDNVEIVTDASTLEGKRAVEINSQLAA